MHSRPLALSREWGNGSRVFRVLGFRVLEFIRFIGDLKGPSYG